MENYLLQAALDTHIATARAAPHVGFAHIAAARIAAADYDGTHIAATTNFRHMPALVAVWALAGVATGCVALLA